MKGHYPIAEFETLTPPVVIHRLAGRIVDAFDAIKTEGGSIQNFRLQDETTGAKVRCAVWNFPKRIKDFENGYLEVESADEVSIVFKPQKRRGQPTDPKIEIRPEAQVIHLLKASEYSGPLSIPHRRVPVPEVAPAAEAATAQPLRFPQVKQGKATKPIGREALAGQIRAIGSLHLLCLDQAQEIVTTAAIKDCERREHPIEGQAPAVAVDLGGLLEPTYLSMVRVAVESGLHLALNDEECHEEPAAARPSAVDQLGALIGDRGPKADVALRMLGKIGKTGTWRDLSEETAAELLAGEFPQLLAS